MSEYIVGSQSRIPTRALKVARAAFELGWSVELRASSSRPTEVTLVLTRGDETWRARFYIGPKLNCWATDVSWMDATFVRNTTVARLEAAFVGQVSAL